VADDKDRPSIDGRDDVTLSVGQTRLVSGSGSRRRDRKCSPGHPRRTGGRDGWSDIRNWHLSDPPSLERSHGCLYASQRKLSITGPVGFWAPSSSQ
jgi:hypothetical protein